MIVGVIPKHGHDRCVPLLFEFARQANRVQSLIDVEERTAEKAGLLTDHDDRGIRIG